MAVLGRAAPFPVPAHQTGRADFPHEMWPATFYAGDLHVRIDERDVETEPRSNH